MKQRKEMYKHKDKLKSNTAIVSENVVLYKEGMTVGELATALNISVGELIKKLMSLGLMMNLNQSIDFETASIITSDIGKELKREELFYTCIYSSGVLSKGNGPEWQNPDCNKYGDYEIVVIDVADVEKYNFLPIVIRSKVIQMYAN